VSALGFVVLGVAVAVSLFFNLSKEK